MEENQQVNKVQEKKTSTDYATSSEKLTEEIEKERKHLNLFDWFLIKFSYKRISLTYSFLVLLIGGIAFALLIAAINGLEEKMIMSEYKKIWHNVNSVLFVLNYYLTLDFLFDNKYTYFLTSAYLYSYLKNYSDLFPNQHIIVSVAFFISALIHYLLIMLFFIIIPSIFSVRIRTTFPKHIIKYYENFKKIDEALESSGLTAKKANKLREKKEKLWNEFKNELKRKAKDPIKFIYFAKDIYVYFFFKIDSIRANIIASFYNERYLKHLRYLLSVENYNDFYNHLFENFYNSSSGKAIVKELNYNLANNMTIYDIKKKKFWKRDKKIVKTDIMKILMTLKLARNFPLEKLYRFLEEKYGIKISVRERVVIKNVRKYFEKKYIENDKHKYIDTQYLILFPDFRNMKLHNEAVNIYSNFLLEKLNQENKLDSLFNEYFLKGNENNLLIAINAYENFKHFMIESLTKIVIIFLKARGVYNLLREHINVEDFVEKVVYNLYFKEFEEKVKSAAEDDEEKSSTDSVINKYSNLSEGNYDLFISKVNAFNIADFFNILETVKKDIQESFIKLNINNEDLNKIVIEPFYEKYYRIVDFEQFRKRYNG